MREETIAKEEATSGDRAIPPKEIKIGINFDPRKHLGVPKDKGKQTNRRKDQADQGRE